MTMPQPGETYSKITEDGRDCTECGEFKVWEEFHKYSRGFHGRRGQCKTCLNDKNQGRSREARREYLWKYMLMRNFRMTPQDYFRMLFEQGGRCAMCRTEESKIHPRSGEVQRLSVDHDRHCCPGTRSCGRCVRGLLCDLCNRQLGPLESRFGDQLPKVLADYLPTRGLAVDS
jgi:hypothetical protein